MSDELLTIDEIVDKLKGKGEPVVTQGLLYYICIILDQAKPVMVEIGEDYKVFSGGSSRAILYKDALYSLQYKNKYVLKEGKFNKRDKLYIQHLCDIYEDFYKVWIDHLKRMKKEQENKINK